MIMAFTVGSALAVAGAGYQSVFRNSLAEPFLLGISGGASLGVVIAIYFDIYYFCDLSLPISAFVGSILVLLIILILSKRDVIEYSNNIMI